MMKIVFLCCVIVLARSQMNEFLGAVIPSSTQSGCIRFSPFVKTTNVTYSPISGSPPSRALIGQLLDTLIQRTSFRCIMPGDMAGAYTVVVEEAAARNLNIFGQVWIDPTLSYPNAGNVAETIRLYNLYPKNIIGITCGLEVAWSNKDLSGSARMINSCISQLKAGGIKVPIGYCDTFDVWCGNSSWPCTGRYDEVYNNVDFLGLDNIPWFDNFGSKAFPCVTARDALENCVTKYTEVKRVFGTTKPILVTSHGWPGNGDTGVDILTSPNTYTGEQCGVANNFNQVAVNQRYVNYLGTNNIGSCLYAAFSEPWLAYGDNSSFLNHWGICEATDYNCTQSPGAVGRAELQFPPEPASRGYITGVIVGSVIGGLAGICCCCLCVACCLFLAFCLYRRKKKDNEDEGISTVIIKEIYEPEPNFDKIEALIIGYGANTPHPTKILLQMMNITPNANNVATYLLLVDMLAMFALVQKKKLKKKQVVALMDVQEHLRHIALVNSSLQYNFDCAIGYLDLLITIGASRPDVQRVVDQVSNTSIDLNPLDITHNWLYQVMLMRLIALDTKNVESLHGLIAVTPQTNWHVTLTAATLLGLIVSRNADTTAIQIGEQFTVVERYNLLDRPFSDIVACSWYTHEQNKAIRKAMLRSLGDIVMSSNCSESIKEQAVMVLLGRELQETDADVAETVYAVMQGVNIAPYMRYIFNNWAFIATKYDQANQKPLLCDENLQRLVQEIQICEGSIVGVHNQLSSTQQNISMQEKMFLESQIQQLNEQLEMLHVEKDAVQQARLQASIELNIIRTNLERMQLKYTKPKMEDYTSRSST
jgi:exo-beta-1,3-glucanase (GH17 family)